MLYDKIQLDADEVVLKTVRKHWFVITVELLGTLILLLLPIGLWIALSKLPNVLERLPMSGAEFAVIFVFAVSMWSLIVLLAAFTIWTHYYLDLWIVTDRRIILVDQISFFNRNVSIFRLERMQDIEFKISGIIPTLLNFGTLKAQTAGAHESNFVSTGLPDPRGLQATIQKCMDDRMAKLHIQPDEVAMHH